MLQGGGALGAYQGGVYQALHEAGLEPDWLAGVSIGAINVVLIAGKGHETVQVFADREAHFDDREVAASALAVRAGGGGSAG